MDNSENCLRGHPTSLPAATSYSGPASSYYAFGGQSTECNLSADDDIFTGRVRGCQQNSPYVCVCVEEDAMVFTITHLSQAPIARAMQRVFDLEQLTHAWPYGADATGAAEAVSMFVGRVREASRGVFRSAGAGCRGRGLPNSDRTADTDAHRVRLEQIGLKERTD